MRQILRSSSYVKKISSFSPARSVCPRPDSLESRASSFSGIPSSMAARLCVTYLGTELFMAVTSSRKCGHGILFHGQDHGLVDVYVPTFADAHADGVAAL